MITVTNMGLILDGSSKQIAHVGKSGQHAQFSVIIVMKLNTNQ